MRVSDNLQYRYATPFDYVLLVTGLICSMGQGAFNAVQSIIFKDLSNTLIEGQENYTKHIFIFERFYDGAMHAIYMYIAYGFGILILSTVSMSCWHTLCERQVHHIRKRFFAAVLRQNMAWFDKHDCGELTTRMTDGMDRIKDGIGDKMGILFTYGTAFISGFVIAFTFSWRMTLVMLAFVPLLAGLVAFLTQASTCILLFVTVSVQKEMRAYENAGAIAEEVITGIRTVIALNGQKNEIARYEKNLKKASEFGIKKAFYIAFGTAWLFCLVFVAMGVAFWFGTKLYIDGLITPGEVFATFWAFIGGTMSLGMAAPQIGALLGARNAATMIFSVIDREPEINSESDEGKTIENPNGEIEFKSVRFHYETRPDEEVLKGITFKVPAEKTVALVGPSGCGKSTLLGLFLRYYNQESGQITVDGVPVNELKIQWLRRMVGVVSQEPVLFAATVEENLRLGNEDMSAEDMERVCRMANAHNFIKQLPEGYKTRIGEGGVQLSGGQKQRLAIARALARDPKILLLDEATSALDTESEKVVQHALDRASVGRTTLTVAHRLSTVKHSDCIIVLDHGEIVESGKHNELMAFGGVYKRMVMAQEIERSTKDNTLPEENEGMTVFNAPLSLPTDEVTILESPKRSRALLAQSSGLSPATSIESSDRKQSRAFSEISSDVNKDIEKLKAEAKAAKAKEVGLLKILSFARKERPVLILAVITSLLKGLTFPIFSIIYGAMFRTLADPSNAAKLAGASHNAIYFTILGVGSGLVTFFGGLLFGMAGELLTTRLRIALFSSIVKQDGEFFDALENASGKLITRLATDAPNIRAAMDQRLSDVIQAASSILAGIGVAFYYGPKMAPVGILTALLLVGAQGLLAQYLKRKSERDEKETREPMRTAYAQLATEAIESHKTVQYLTREQHFYNEFSRQMRRPHINTIERGLIMAINFGLHACYIFFNFAAAYRFGIWLVGTNNYTPYIIFQVIEALNIASMSLIAVGTYFPEYVRARLSATLIFSLINREPKIDSLSFGGKIMKLDGNVKLNNVHFAYAINQRNLVLRNFNLEAVKGKTVALVGPSGSGKSTVIQLLERFYDPLDGQVLYDERMCNEVNLQKLRSQIGLVSQEPILFNYSIRDNIAYGLNSYTEQQIEEAAKQANAYKFIKEMSQGFDTNVGEKGNKLSGGQKQRIAIARAIIRKPMVLLMDEATSALDSESENIVQEALDRARSGRTCIVIAHRLSSIQNSDMIMVINDGTVIEYGTHQQLLCNNGLYARLTEMQTLN